MVSSYYTKLLALDIEACGSLTKDLFSALTRSALELREREFDDNEIKAALWGMSPHKAPGPNGFNACFFQRPWGTIDLTVVRLAKRILEGGEMPEGLADALLVLIPKKKSPRKVEQFRPISLCNLT